MTIGAALLVFAVGAILRFAIATANTHGIGVHTIGDILMGVGVVGLILWLIIWMPRRRRSVPVDRRPPPDAEQPPEYYRSTHEHMRSGDYRDYD